LKLDHTFIYHQFVFRIFNFAKVDDFVLRPVFTVPLVVAGFLSIIPSKLVKLEPDTILKTNVIFQVSSGFTTDFFGRIATPANELYL
jgi:hypothetical protein